MDTIYFTNCAVWTEIFFFLFKCEKSKFIKTSGYTWTGLYVLSSDLFDRNSVVITNIHRMDQRHNQCFCFFYSESFSFVNSKGQNAKPSFFGFKPYFNIAPTLCFTYSSS